MARDFAAYKLKKETTPKIIPRGERRELEAGKIPFFESWSSLRCITRHQRFLAL
jgi:hypothetical protein